jgi:hypothetical protein
MMTTSLIGDNWLWQLWQCYWRLSHSDCSGGRRSSDLRLRGATFGAKSKIGKKILAARFCAFRATL